MPAPDVRARPTIIAFTREGEGMVAEEMAADAARVMAELEATTDIARITHTPADLPNGPICDIDRVQPVAWTYPCDSFMLPELRWESVTDWALCEACAACVEAEDMDGLWSRFFAVAVFSAEERANERAMRAIELVQRSVFEAFMLHRWGERRPFNPNEDHEMPEAIRVLPRDERGLPIPYAQLRVEGRPDFRSLDMVRVAECVHERKCGICGRPLDYWIAFIGGPACQRNRLFRDPAMHEQCAAYATRVCPFIGGSQTKYSTRPLPEGEGLAVHLDRNMADHERRPAEMFLFTTRRYKAVKKHGETYIEASPWVRVRRIDPIR